MLERWIQRESERGEETDRGRSTVCFETPGPNNQYFKKFSAVLQTERKYGVPNPTLSPSLLRLCLLFPNSTFFTFTPDWTFDWTFFFFLDIYLNPSSPLQSSSHSGKQLHPSHWQRNSQRERLKKEATVAVLTSTCWLCIVITSHHSQQALRERERDMRERLRTANEMRTSVSSVCLGGKPHHYNPSPNNRLTNKADSGIITFTLIYCMSESRGNVSFWWGKNFRSDEMLPKEMKDKLNLKKHFCRWPLL